ncbi:MAG: hypothetical protein ACI3XR_08950 [Eubacteriales bacterium]
MITGLKDKDIDTVLECIEPETAQSIEFIMSLTGMSAEDLLTIIPTDALMDNASSSKPKFAGYKRDGDTACISFSMVSEEETTTCEINFVRISGTWYLSLG